MFDRLALWFYAGCAALFLIFTAADFNGSSMAVLDWNYRVGGPQTVLAGTPKMIRADEWSYETPDILRQVFGERRFDVYETGLGNHSVGLLGNLPVRHVTTWMRPQYWPFWVLPADYAFAAWWQAKWLLLVTGSFTLLLMLTGSSAMAIAGSAWLLWSQFTQVCYSWPSMLPEMAGVFCFAMVFACYLSVGRSTLALALIAVACAACVINFALFAYVPHQIPFVWAGVLMLAAWCWTYRHRILDRESRRQRVAAAAMCALIAGAMLAIIYRDTHVAIEAIRMTEYPGRRSIDGGSMTAAELASHFFAASENGRRFPASMTNICEASGFLWLAPVTLLCFGAMRRLSREQRALLGGLWAGVLLITVWLVVPIPASLGRFLLLDKVADTRALPALGLLNIAIVILVLSGARPGKPVSFAWKLGAGAAVFGLALTAANRGLDGYFRASEIGIATAWAAVLAASILDGRRMAFAIAAVVPNLLLFGMFNPLQRGIGAVTSSALFQLVHREPRLLHGTWLVFTKRLPAGLFSAVGCDLYDGLRYLPDIDHFALLRSNGVDVRPLNNLGYFDALMLKPGERARAQLDEAGTVQLSVSPLDPLVKELGIRYVAFEKQPPGEIAARLKAIGDGPVSGFRLYELP
ncbi:MAG: hypothetical protein JWO80_5585 [Bryobacterales bacterium]|nr:hypothetical protein [Bryobacterales bacterium]